MSKKTGVFFIICLILLILVGGFFYWRKAKNNESKSPSLFSKDDYKIIEKNGEKFIEVEKVGLSAKIPEGWSINFEGSDYPKSEYWIDVYSPDAEFSDILRKGCGISIMAGINKEDFKKINENISFLEQSPDKSNEIKNDYRFEILEINNINGLKWSSPKIDLIGQFAGINFPIKKEGLISFNTSFPPDYEQNCSQIWEEFIKNIEIK